MGTFKLTLFYRFLLLMQTSLTFNRLALLINICKQSQQDSRRNSKEQLLVRPYASVFLAVHSITFNAQEP